MTQDIRLNLAAATRFQPHLNMYIPTYVFRERAGPALIFLGGIFPPIIGLGRLAPLTPILHYD